MNRRRVWSLSVLAMALGLLTVAWPLAWAPAWSFAIAGVAAAVVVAAAVLHWRPGPALAVAAAVVSCAFSAAGVAVLAAEGLFILGYLLAVDAPAGLVAPGRWLRRQAPLLVAGLITAGTAWPPRSPPTSPPCRHGREAGLPFLIDLFRSQQRTQHQSPAGDPHVPGGWPVRRHSPSWRAMSIRWTSLVPSPISRIFASR